MNEDNDVSIIVFTSGRQKIDGIDAIEVRTTKRIDARYSFRRIPTICLFRIARESFDPLFSIRRTNESDAPF